jgi:hypothetical protein
MKTHNHIIAYVKMTALRITVPNSLPHTILKNFTDDNIDLHYEFITEIHQKYN